MELQRRIFDDKACEVAGCDEGASTDLTDIKVNRTLKLDAVLEQTERVTLASVCDEHINELKTITKNNKE
jgi:hypothetical protein